MAQVLLKVDLSPNAILVLNDISAGITQAFADARYLKLAADNDPLTGTLSTQILLPSANATYGLGSSSLRYADAFLTGLNAFKNSASGGVNTITLDSPSSANLLVNAVGSAGNRTFVAAPGVGYSSTTIGGIYNDTAGVTGTLSSSGAGSFAAGYVNLFVGFTGSSGTISSSGAGAVALGNVYTGLNTGVCSSVITASNSGAIAIGQAGSTVFGGTGCVATIRATQRGSFAAGSAIITATGVTATVQATGAGSLAHGEVLRGAITASGAGSFAQGYVAASSNTVSLLASGAGAVALGQCTSSGALSAAGAGSLVVASVAATDASCTGSNSQQFGPGSNLENDCLKIGVAGLRFKGTAGAPGTPINGDFYMGSTGNAFVQVQSNGQVVTLGPVNTWTTGSFATKRNTTTSTALIGTLTTTGAATDFGIQGVTLAGFGFVNAAEGDTLVNSVANLQIRTTELWEVLETLVEDLRTANVI